MHTPTPEVTPELVPQQRVEPHTAPLPAVTSCPSFQEQLPLFTLNRPRAVCWFLYLGRVELEAPAAGLSRQLAWRWSCGRARSSHKV